MKTHDKRKSIWQNDWNVSDVDDSVNTSAKSDGEAIVDNKNKSQIDESIEQVKIADLEISDADYMKSLIKTKPGNSIKKPVEKVDASKLTDLLTIKIRNIPFKTKRQDVLNFFKPIKPSSIRLPTQVKGICYVGFKNEADFKKAMLKNRSFWSK